MRGGMSVGMAVIVRHVFRLAPDWAYWMAMASILGAIVPLNRFVSAPLARLEPAPNAEEAAT